jgi:predicted RNA-binding protein Jag
MHKQKYVGKTLEDALDQAARDLGAERENIAYNIIPSEGGSLLKKFLFKTISVEAWVEKTEDLAAAARKAVREAIEGGAAKRYRKNDQRGGRNADKPLEARNQNQKGQKSDKAGNKAADKAPQAPRNGRQSKNSPNSPAQAANQNSRYAQSGNAQSANAKEPRQRRPDPRRNREVPAEPNPNAITFETQGVREILEDYTKAFLKVFEADLDSTKFEKNEAGNITVRVKSELLEDLLARSDRLSSSFEHVFKRIMQKKLGDLAQRLHLEAGDATEKRLENLRQMAISMADKVKETGRSITVNSKSGQERRIIHVTIDEIDGVATRSMGSGDNRKLVIYSTDSRHKRSGPRRQRGEAQDAGQQDQQGNAPGQEARMDSEGIAGATHGNGEGTPRRGRSRRGRSRGRRGSGSSNGADSRSSGGLSSGGMDESPAEYAARSEETP